MIDSKTKSLYIRYNYKFKHVFTKKNIQKILMVQHDIIIKVYNNDYKINIIKCILSIRKVYN